MMAANRFFKKGQSLIELAIFSTMIFTVMGVLVSYGLSFSHNQHIAMLAFKRANYLADQVARTSLNANITLVYDKAIADPMSMFGLSSRVPMISSSQALRSNDLYSDVDGSDEELPRTVYDINGKVYTFRTAAFVSKSGGGISKTYIEHWNGQGISWTNESCQAEPNQSCDVDGDGEDEVGIEGGRVMDYQEGELNMSESNPNLSNGLIGDSQTLTINRSQLYNFQQEDTFRTRTRQDNVHLTVRFIRLNPNLRDFSHILAQMAVQNPGYGGGFVYYCDQPGEHKPPVECNKPEPEGADYLLLCPANGEVFLAVENQFRTDKDAYVWAVK